MLYWQVNTRLKCKVVRASHEILHIHIKPLHHSMYPIINIIYSAPALNTHSCRRILLNINPVKAQQQAINKGTMNNFLHYFTLPNNLSHNSILRLTMNDTALYQLQYAGENVVNQWREAKKERARKRKQREMRKKAEKMAKLHRLLNWELCQAHKLSLDGRGKPMWW